MEKNVEINPSTYGKVSICKRSDMKFPLKYFDVTGAIDLHY